jgi:hypothetical protein
MESYRGLLALHDPPLLVSEGPGPGFPTWLCWGQFILILAFCQGQQKLCTCSFYKPSLWTWKDAGRNRCRTCSQSICSILHLKYTTLIPIVWISYPRQKMYWQKVQIRKWRLTWNSISMSTEILIELWKNKNSQESFKRKHQYLALACVMSIVKGTGLKIRKKKVTYMIWE